ncbi:phosphatidylserine decarboxylase [Haloferax mediterranei ATCC 33500]|uniref:Putative archaetidylserine decarboxylase proenzyme n=1 Tax=Haloferax mediterranei (strain ATCC 33500 / DSM 1411 / JCM 8866 / NBRC 14739 / NCIMB 2177 / R-4) TaxID=523841 RepID=I3R0Y6_HALMT|nr:protein sorting system archaetidylserine decarboxylase [Haloferax mediterranei]AFK17896.1 phosphatidylserine decarboxylase [Haloferax mediterranei ATCC 33500]AHZ22680.1 phosphatidylserine decarboxylase [Haloferax mediterranei ATCC 33500]EMA02829.1 phosphatidylserine decarboxylase [Haloferax mediterranei ATCC 33500]MDX5987987.1 protein sorting system archaetidylserine decarboxylase [Haloferax mediterranei ATCC 33500]QCQ74455.1 phosphatidylserine decarboxylase [Haloferax mediterranei ATCC 335
MRFAPGYRRFAVPAFLGAALAAFVFPPAGAVLLGVGVFVLWFFRDPERSPPDEDGVISPADGHVSVIRVEDGRVRVGVFMNVTDVHVNRAPVSGTVSDVTHRPGAHKPAFSKDSDRNERVDITVDSDDGDYEVSLIAGAFARRIHPYVAPGDELARGDKIGHIDFGSRADVLLPPEFGSEDVIVEKGESVRAGETVLARRD